MNIANIIGLSLNIVGSIMMGFSFGKNPEGAYSNDKKGKKVYLASLLRPKLFYFGVGIIIIGFILQVIGCVVLTNNSKETEVQYPLLLKFIFESFVAVGTILVPIFAWIGFNAWKKQLKGTTEYQMAIKLLQSIFSVRNAIKSVRNPFVYVGEHSDRERKENELPKESSMKDEEHAYRNRLRKLNPFVESFDVIKIEAEVLWGKQINILLDDLRSKVIKLYSSYQTYYLIILQEGESAKRGPGGPYDNYYKILFYPGESDLFDNEINDSVDKIEDFCRKYMK